MTSKVKPWNTKIISFVATILAMKTNNYIIDLATNK